MVVGTLFFGAKRSNQWTLCMQYMIDAVCSGIVVYDGEDIVFDTKKVKPVDAVDTGCSGCSRIVVYGGGDIVFDTKRSNQWTQCMQYAVRSTQWMQWNSGIC